MSRCQENEELGSVAHLKCGTQSTASKGAKDQESVRLVFRGPLRSFSI